MGWYIHMDVARKALDDLAANASVAPIFSSQDSTPPKSGHRVGQPADAALGAIGPEIFFLLPDFQPPYGQTIWNSPTPLSIYTRAGTTLPSARELAMGPSEQCGRPGKCAHRWSE